MLKNYVLIACRALLNNKLFSVINIFGLALSMSVGMIVLIRVVDAFEYDTFHDDAGSIYRIISRVENAQGEHWKLASSPLPLKQALCDEGIKSEDITHFYPAIDVTAKDRSREFGVRGVFVDPSFFSVFGFTSQFGSAKKALQSPKRVLLSRALAEKFFGQQDPTDKAIHWEIWASLK